MSKKSLLALVMMVAFVAISANAYGWANPDLLMNPDDVEKIAAKPDWVILDCRGKEAYGKEHIPGAIVLDCRKDLRDGTERVSKPAQLEKILGGAGISNDKHVVVYGDAKDIVHASVGFWILEYMGHDKTHFLDGGLTEWKAAGKPVTTEPKTLPQATFKANVVPSRYASTEEILKIAKGETKGVQVIDARTEKEYNGKESRSLRGGRIPNTTINVSHDITYDKRTGKLLPEKFLEGKFYGALDKNKRTIGLCQTGSRSTLTYLQLRLLGFKDPTNYDDSWIVYGNSVYPPYPVENEQWINMEGLVKMPADIKKLKKEIEDLRKELKLPPKENK
ncbi:MAG: rhodanese-like domain-containing protein [Nitrospiraceae bacterium]|nr:rhodanese-like domain-containing protein [Nitrospiraceae bacterium]